MPSVPTIVTFPWALRLAREDAPALAGLRLMTGLEAAEAGRELWLRGRSAEESLSRQLLALPAVERFEWRSPDLLRRLDQRIPCRTFPALRWQALSVWLQVELPAAALPATEPAPVTLRLVRSGEERPPEMLLTTFDAFRGFVATAARIRLERLNFAASFDGRVLVRGRPLPPLPGTRFVLHEGVAVPAGLGWFPEVSPEVLARRFNATETAPVLWNADGTFLRFHSEQFVPATRSAVLATARAQTEIG